MADGSHRPIEEVQAGDKVVATDPETGEQEAKTVERVFVHDDTVVDLNIDGEIIATTEDHPFWSVTDQQFERADELTAGEKVLGADGRILTVSGLEPETGREVPAYNLSVEGIHTYHVGQNEVLVHNTCGINLPTPQVESVKLQNLVNNLYKGTTNPNRVGNGTTMDAIRHELVTSTPVGNRFHSTKGQETLRGLENWMRRNPDALYHDRLVAQSLADELTAVLRGAG
jgi:hypothetical protein